MASPTPRPVSHAAAELAENLSAWRKLNGLTERQVADRAGISRATVQRFVRDPGSISLENFLRIARAVGILAALVEATDPLMTDVGRLRAGERLPQRVRPRPAAGAA